MRHGVAFDDKNVVFARQRHPDALRIAGARNAHEHARMNHDTINLLRSDMLQHAAAAYPQECCGIIIQTAAGPAYRRARNMLAGSDEARDRFEIHPSDWAAAEDAGAVLAIVHSHPDACAHPSQADRVMCERTECTWVIVGWPSEAVVVIEPVGYEAPLEGREFVHGVLDCYTLIRDYYQRSLAITLPDFERPDGWWERGATLYRDGFGEAGFIEVEGPPQAHDVLLMKVASRVENHGAIYIGDGSILHHLYGRLSCTDVWGGYWVDHTTAILRHRDLCAGAEVL